MLGVQGKCCFSCTQVVDKGIHCYTQCMTSCFDYGLGVGLCVCVYVCVRQPVNPALRESFLLPSFIETLEHSFFLEFP